MYKQATIEGRNDVLMRDVYPSIEFLLFLRV